MLSSQQTSHTEQEQVDQIVVFDVWSSFAYFRRPYTTTNALTYDFMPRSSIEGLIGAILGIQPKEVSKKLQGAKIALGLLNPVKKLPFSTIHTHTDFWYEMNAYLELRVTSGKKDFRARAGMELLIEPRYRVYFSDRNYESQLAELLERHETVFTPYLGTSTMIANFSYLGTFEYTSSVQDLSELSSILPYKVKLPAIAIERRINYAIEQDIPSRIDENRELLSSYSAIYNPDGLKIKVKNMVVNSFEFGGSRQNFVFLPS